MSEQPPTVALLGTGTMGAGMARRIAAAGMPLRFSVQSPQKRKPHRRQSAGRGKGDGETSGGGQRQGAKEAGA